MGSLRTRDLHSFSRNLTILVPSIHGSPLVYFHQTPPGEYLGGNGREVSSCCYHAHVSRKIKKWNNWERKDHPLARRFKGEPFQLAGKIGPPLSVHLPIFENVASDNSPQHHQSLLWIYSFDFAQVFPPLSRCQYSENSDTCFSSFIPFLSC